MRPILVTIATSIAQIRSEMHRSAQLPARKSGYILTHVVPSEAVDGIASGQT